MGDGVVGNLVLAAAPIGGPIAMSKDNLVDTAANAGGYVNSPSTTLGQLDLYPLPGKCEGAPLDLAPFAGDTDYSRDFNGASKGGFTFRGAYAGAGQNPGWMPQDGVKPLPGAGPSPDGGVPADLATPRGDGSGGSGGDAATSDAAGGGASGGGCGCRIGERDRPSGWPLAGLLALLAIAARRREG
jgi:MYXO-CTERM domain-containing protein